MEKKDVKRVAKVLAREIRSLAQGGVDLKHVAFELRGCQRCGGSHDDYNPSFFTEPPDGYVGFWMCPKTNEPALVSIKEKNDE